DAMQWMRELALAALGDAFDASRRRWSDLFADGDRWGLACLPAAAPAAADRARVDSPSARAEAGARLARMQPALDARAATAAPAGPVPHDHADAPSLWPTSAVPDRRHGAGGTRLRLLSPPGRAAALAEARLVVVCVVRNERTMLPHFLAHYRRLGAQHFVFIDNLSDDGTRDWLLAQPDVVLYSTDTDYCDSHL